jgi:phage terminase large subunit-like protein
MKLDLEFFRGKQVYLGLDTSKIEDLSSLVVLHHDKINKRFYAFPFIYFANNPIKKIRNRGIDITKWLLSGEIKQCADKRIDYIDIIEDILYINSICEIINVGHDNYNKSEIIPILDNNVIRNTAVSQSIANINSATKLLDRILANGELVCINDAFKWQFSNVVIYTDINNNIKCNKKKSLDSIDSVIALINALELWRRDNEKDYYKVDTSKIQIKL